MIKSLFSGPGTFSGPRLMTPCPRGQRFLAPPSRFPASAKHITEPICARHRTITDVLQIITPYWCMVSTTAPKRWVNMCEKTVCSFLSGMMFDVHILFYIFDHFKHVVNLTDAFISPLSCWQWATGPVIRDTCLICFFRSFFFSLIHYILWIICGNYSAADWFHKNVGQCTQALIDIVIICAMSCEAPIYPFPSHLLLLTFSTLRMWLRDKNARS